MKRVCGLLLAVTFLAGCGSDEPTAAEKRMQLKFDRLDYEMGNVEISAPPYQENLQRLTTKYIALIHQYEDELGTDEVKKRLEDKALELDDYCLPCSGAMDAERAKY
jgi:hypothetical protein